MIATGGLIARSQDGIQHIGIRDPPGVVINDLRSDIRITIKLAIQNIVPKVLQGFVCIGIVSDTIIFCRLLSGTISNEREDERDTGLHLREQTDCRSQFCFFPDHTADVRINMRDVDRHNDFAGFFVTHDRAVRIVSHNTVPVFIQHMGSPIDLSILLCDSEKGVGKEDGRCFHQVQFTDQVQSVLLPCGAGKRGGVNRVLPFDFSADHGLCIKQDQRTDNHNNHQDQGESQDLPALPFSCVFYLTEIHASFLKENRCVVCQFG